MKITTQVPLECFSNGDYNKGMGVYKQVSLQLDGKVVNCEDFLPLELGSAEVILGIQWLETLGPSTANGKSQVMQCDQVSG